MAIDIPITDTSCYRVQALNIDGKQRIALRPWVRSWHGMDSRLGKWKATNRGLMLETDLVPKVIEALQDEYAAAPVEPSAEWLGWVERKCARVASERSRVASAREIVLRAMPVLAAMGVQGNLSAGSSGYLPRLILFRELGEGCSRRDLDRAARELLAEGVIERVVIGKYANRARRYALALRAPAT